jgi:hypothetical protein
VATCGTVPVRGRTRILKRASWVRLLESNAGSWNFKFIALSTAPPSQGRPQEPLQFKEIQGPRTRTRIRLGLTALRLPSLGVHPRWQSPLWRAMPVGIMTGTSPPTGSEETVHRKYEGLNCGSYTSDRAREGYCGALRPTPSGSGQCSESKPTELGPESGPRWTRCDNRCNFLYNRIVYRNTGSGC